jgi:hypothetical protein
MHKTRALLLLVAATATALTLAACGGDDDDGGGGEEEDAIIEVIETSVTSTDPADCTRLETQAFLEQTQFSVGDEAVQDCEEDKADTENDPDSVEVENVEVDGSSATAEATFSGSAFDGATASVDLVKEGDQWKLDAITDIEGIDVETFRDDFTAQLEESEEIPAPIADCISEAIGSATEEDVRGVIVGGTEEDLLGLFGDCIPTS